MRLDLIDVFYLSPTPYVAGEGRRVFDNVGKYGPLDLVSHAVQQRRDRAGVPAAPLNQRPASPDQAGGDA
jgi:hypothetical protein